MKHVNLFDPGRIVPAFESSPAMMEPVHEKSDGAFFIQPDLKPIPMMSRKRKFSDEQKMEILNQAKQIGVIAAIRNHCLSYSVFSRWREKFMQPDNAKKENLFRNKVKTDLK